MVHIAALMQFYVFQCFSATFETKTPLQILQIIISLLGSSNNSKPQVSFVYCNVPGVGAMAFSCFAKGFSDPGNVSHFEVLGILPHVTMPLDFDLLTNQSLKKIPGYVVLGLRARHIPHCLPRLEQVSGLEMKKKDVLALHALHVFELKNIIMLLQLDALEIS